MFQVASCGAEHYSYFALDLAPLRFPVRAGHTVNPLILTLQVTDALFELLGAVGMNGAEVVTVPLTDLL